MSVNDLLRSVEAIRPILVEEAPKCERDRRMTTRAFHALRDIGLFTIHTPKRFGGIELHPTDCLRVWEAVGRIDASIGWNAFMTHGGVPPMAAWLTEEGVNQIYDDGIPTMAGVLTPALLTEKVDGGWKITGTAPFASGCNNVDWFLIPMHHE
jgi:alkylation response protein AidB-like acyl-CoA dehydrogenase